MLGRWLPLSRLDSECRLNERQNTSCVSNGGGSYFLYPETKDKNLLGLTA